MTSRPLRLLQTSILSTFDWTSLALATLTRRRRTRVLTSESQTEGGGGCTSTWTPSLDRDAGIAGDGGSRWMDCGHIRPHRLTRACVCAPLPPPPARSVWGVYGLGGRRRVLPFLARHRTFWGRFWHIRHSGGRCVGVKNALKSIIYRLYMLSISRVCGEPPGLCRPPGLPRTGSH